MLRYTPPTQGQGDRISTIEWNKLRDYVAQFMRIQVGPGLLVDFLSGAPVISLATQSTATFLVTNAITAAPAPNQPGVGQGVQQAFNAGTGLFGPTGTAEQTLYNLTDAPVAEGSYAQFSLQDNNWFFALAYSSPGTKTFQLTTDLAAAPALNQPGSGTAVMQTFDITTGLFEVVDGTEVTVFNLTNIEIIAGSYVQFNWQDGAFFYCVTNCTNGVT